jgi:predicted flap endonuclease-1-like 5' DNA nuclease
MNILIFVTGVAVGFAADKLYHSLIANRNHTSEDRDLLALTEKNASGQDASAHVESSVSDATSETATAKDESTAESVQQVQQNAEKHDDLGQLKGVGPKLEEALERIGIYNYKQLSESPVDVLLEKLRETGGRFSRSVISAVVERAQYASEN